MSDPQAVEHHFKGGSFVDLAEEARSEEDVVFVEQDACICRQEHVRLAVGIAEDLLQQVAAITAENQRTTRADHSSDAGEVLSVLDVTNLGTDRGLDPAGMAPGADVHGVLGQKAVEPACGSNGESGVFFYFG